VFTQNAIAFDCEEHAVDHQFGIDVYRNKGRIICAVLGMFGNEAKGFEQREEVHDGDQEDAVNICHIHLQPRRELALNLLGNSDTVEETPSGFDEEQTLRIGTRFLQLVLDFLDCVQS
jgi:hypothetical protein